MGRDLEVTLRFKGENAQLLAAIAQVRRDLSGLNQTQVAAVATTSRRAVNETIRAEQRRIAETVRAANLRLREEQRAAREVARIVAETARQAAAQDRLRERAAKQLADVRIREGKRAARELERSLAGGRGTSGGFDISGVLGGLTGRLPGVGGLTSELSSLTSAATSAGGAVAALAGPLGVAALAAAGTAGAAALAARELFELVQRSSEAPGHLFDIHQKAAFAVETLSALSNSADTAGTSIDDIVPSLIIFQKNIEAVREGNKGLGVAFKNLGIDVSDNETALRSAFRALAAMPDGYNKTAAAMRIFGRGGKEILALIKETNGDIDAAIERYSALGTLIGTDAAKAADQFEQQYKDVQKQLQAVEREIALQVMPTVINFLQATSDFLSSNKYAWQQWGSLINDTIKAMIAPTSPLGGLLTMLQLINAYLNANAKASTKITVGQQQFDLPPGVRPEDAFQMFAAQSGQDPESRRLQALRKSGFVDLGLGGGGGGGGRGAPRRDPGVELLKQLQQELDRLIPKTKAQEIAQQLLGKEFNKTSDAVKRVIQITAMDIDIQKTVLGITRERTVALKTLNQEFQETVNLVRQAGEQGLPFFSRRRSVSDITGMDFFDLGGGSVFSNLERSTRERVATEVEGLGGLGTELGSLAESVNPFKDALSSLKEIGADAFASLGQGIGAMVQQWVLLGSQADINMRKVIGSVLAGVAAQSASLAVFHTAMGIAALTPFGSIIYGSAAQHFAAAALFASIAAGTGLIGRAISGNSFANEGGNAFQAAGARGGSGGISSGSTTAPAAPKPVDLNRNSAVAPAAPAAPVIHIHLSGEAAAMFDYKVVEVVARDVDLNGRLRGIISKESQW